MYNTKSKLAFLHTYKYIIVQYEANEFNKYNNYIRCNEYDKRTQ